MPDIFSALVIMVPPLLPVAVGMIIRASGHYLFGQHANRIFYTSVGMNCLLPAIGSKSPQLELYTATLPFFMVLLFALMLPAFSPTSAYSGMTHE